MNDLNIFILAGSRIIKQIKEKLAIVFDMTDMGPLIFYVRLKITYNYKQKITKLSQLSYTKKLLD